MPTTAETINYNSFLSVTTKEYSRETKGQYLTRRPAVGLLFDQYRHTDSNGGRTQQSMVDYGQSATAQFYSGSDTFSTQPQEVAQPLRYDWKYLGGSISATQTEHAGELRPGGSREPLGPQDEAAHPDVRPHHRQRDLL